MQRAELRKRSSTPHAARFIARLLCVAPLLAGMISAAPTPAPAAAPTATVRAAIVPQDMLAHGSNGYFWIATIGNDPAAAQPGVRTRIYSRVPSKEAWEHLSDLPARAVGLANTGTQLAVLLESGEWQLLSEDGVGSSGQPLPDNARMIAIANDADSLWALGLQPPGAATRPAPAEAAPTTRAAAGRAQDSRATGANAAETRPTHGSAPSTRAAGAGARDTGATGDSSGGASSRLVLFVMKDGAWQRAPAPPLPDTISRGEPLSLTIIEHTPWIAVYREGASGAAIEVLRAEAAGWKSAATQPAPASPRAFKLLAHTAAPVLWTAGNDRDRLCVFGAGGAPRQVALKPLAAPVADRAAAVAMFYTRDLAIVEGRLHEQDYEPGTGAPTGSPAPVTLPGPNSPSPFTGLYRLILVVLVIVMLSSARRRREPGEQAAKVGNLALADLGRRLAAGLIDAVPFLAPAVLFARLYQSGALRPESGGSPSFPRDADMELVLWGCAALLVYLLHTALGESISGRSIGKWALGLRVVKLNGGRPDSSSILIRNFLRVVDVGLFGLPLLLITYSPLRQRIGDVAAGTVVIRDRVTPEGNLVEPEKTEAASATPEASGAEPPTPAGD